MISSRSHLPSYDPLQGHQRSPNVKIGKIDLLNHFFNTCDTEHLRREIIATHRSDKKYT